MLIRVGAERSITIDLYLAASLASIAGALNAVGFLVAGSFTANMTGNVSAFADHLAEGSVLLALSFAGLLLAFVAGAGLAALAIGAGLRRGHLGVFAWAIAAEAVLLLALGSWLGLGPAPLPESLQVIVLSFVMGVQNAVSTLVSGGRVRSTHVSGMATDLGIELAAMTGTAAERHEAAPKLGLHGVTLFCFALGGVCGALLYGLVGHWLFLLAGLSLLALALPEALLARRGGLRPR